jgi:hypothetical protein
MTLLALVQLCCPFNQSQFQVAPRHARRTNIRRQIRPLKCGKGRIREIQGIDWQLLRDKCLE